MKYFKIALNNKDSSAAILFPEQANQTQGNSALDLNFAIYDVTLASAQLHIHFFILFRWRNWWIRGVFTFLMIGLFVGFLYVGQMALAFMVSVVPPIAL